MVTLLVVSAVVCTLVTAVVAAALMEHEPVFAVGAGAASICFILWLSVNSITGLEQQVADLTPDTVPAVVDTTGVNDG